MLTLTRSLLAGTTNEVKKTRVVKNPINLLPASFTFYAEGLNFTVDSFCARSRSASMWVRFGS